MCLFPGTARDRPRDRLRFPRDRQGPLFYGFPNSNSLIAVPGGPWENVDGPWDGPWRSLGKHKVSSACLWRSLGKPRSSAPGPRCCNMCARAWCTRAHGCSPQGVCGPHAAFGPNTGTTSIAAFLRRTGSAPECTPLEEDPAACSRAPMLRARTLHQATYGTPHASLRSPPPCATPPLS